MAINILFNEWKWKWNLKNSELKFEAFYSWAAVAYNQRLLQRFPFIAFGWNLVFHHGLLHDMDFYIFNNHGLIDQHFSNHIFHRSVLIRSLVEKSMNLQLHKFILSYLHCWKTFSRQLSLLRISLICKWFHLLKTSLDEFLASTYQ